MSPLGHMFFQATICFCFCFFFVGYPKQRSGVPRNGFSPKPDLQAREAERQLVQRLKERSERQARQLSLAQRELGRAVCGFQALAVATQHFFRKVRPRLADGEGRLAGGRAAMLMAVRVSVCSRLGLGFDLQTVTQNPQQRRVMLGEPSSYSGAKGISLEGMT